MAPLIYRSLVVDGLHHVCDGRVENLRHGVDPHEDDQGVGPVVDLGVVDLQDLGHRLCQVQRELGCGQLKAGNARESGWCDSGLGDRELGGEMGVVS